MKTMALLNVVHDGRAQGNSITSIRKFHRSQYKQIASYSLFGERFRESAHVGAKAGVPRVTNG